MKKLAAIAYWFVHLTWGILTFIPAVFVAIFMLLTNADASIFGFSICFATPYLNELGAFSLGPIICIPKSYQTTALKQHEHGHGIQTLMFGPLMLFIVSFPSLIRAGYRNWKANKMRTKWRNGEITLDEYATWLKNRPGYYDIWFESQASELGEKWFPED